MTVCQGIDKNNILLTLLVSLQKAFDTIGHLILPEKLDNFGFRGSFHSFLKNCTVALSMLKW